MTHEEFAVERLAIIIHDAMCPDSNGDMMTWPAEVFTTARAVHAAGYRRPRTITTAEELDALPGSAVVKDALTQVFEKQEVGQWHDGPHDWLAFDGKFWDVDAIHHAATVLHEPEQP